MSQLIIEWSVHVRCDQNGLYDPKKLEKNVKETILGRRDQWSSSGQFVSLSDLNGIYGPQKFKKRQK